MDSRWKHPNLPYPCITFMLVSATYFSSVKFPMENMHLVEIITVEDLKIVLWIQCSKLQKQKKETKSHAEKHLEEKWAPMEKRKNENPKTINSNECQEYWKYTYSYGAVVACMVVVSELWYAYMISDLRRLRGFIRYMHGMHTRIHSTLIPLCFEEESKCIYNRT